MWKKRTLYASLTSNFSTPNCMHIIFLLENIGCHLLQTPWPNWVSYPNKHLRPGLPTRTQDKFEYHLRYHALWPLSFFPRQWSQRNGKAGLDYFFIPRAITCQWRPTSIIHLLSVTSLIFQPPGIRGEHIILPHPPIPPAYYLAELFYLRKVYIFLISKTTLLVLYTIINL